MLFRRPRYVLYRSSNILEHAEEDKYQFNIHIQTQKVPIYFPTSEACVTFTLMSCASTDSQRSDAIAHRAIFRIGTLRGTGSSVHLVS